MTKRRSAEITTALHTFLKKTRTYFSFQALLEIVSIKGEYGTVDFPYPEGMGLEKPITQKQLRTALDNLQKSNLVEMVSQRDLSIGETRQHIRLGKSDGTYRNQDEQDNPAKLYGVPQYPAEQTIETTHFKGLIATLAKPFVDNDPTNPLHLNIYHEFDDPDFGGPILDLAADYESTFGVHISVPEPPLERLNGIIQLLHDVRRSKSTIQINLPGIDANKTFYPIRIIVKNSLYQLLCIENETLDIHYFPISASPSDDDIHFTKTRILPSNRITDKLIGDVVSLAIELPWSETCHTEPYQYVDLSIPKSKFGEYTNHQFPLETEFVENGENVAIELLIPLSPQALRWIIQFLPDLEDITVYSSVRANIKTIDVEATDDLKRRLKSLVLESPLLQ